MLRVGGTQSGSWRLCYCAEEPLVMNPGSESSERWNWLKDGVGCTFFSDILVIRVAAAAVSAGKVLASIRRILEVVAHGSTAEH